MTQIGDEYSADGNSNKRTTNGLWAWFLAIPWYWKVLAAALYLLLWIVSPETAFYLTFFMFSGSKGGGSKMGGGKFGGGGN